MITFKTAARYLMPTLTTANVTVPALVLENMITSIETRVTAPTPVPHPCIAYPNIIPRSVIMCYPAHLDHPCTLPRLMPLARAQGLEVVHSKQTPKTKKFVTVEFLPDPCTSDRVRPDLLPFQHPQFAWTTQRKTGSRVLFHRSTRSFTSRPRALLSPKRSPNGSLITSTVSTGTLQPVRSNERSTWNLAVASARATPLRDAVNEFLQMPEMNWLKTVQLPMDFDDWVKRYPQTRREQLATARVGVLSSGELTAKDAMIKNFIKRETSHNFTDPRNISPRSDEFLSIIGPYISAIEHQAVRSRFLVKGLSPRQRARKVSWLTNYNRFMEVDYSRFDMTISADILRIFEHAVLKRQFPRTEHELYHQALDLALTTQGVSSYGTRYERQGGRCSGDAHTSIANGLLNYFLTWVCLQNLPKNSWRSIHEGDDGIIAFNAQYEEQIRANMTFLSCLGFKAKIRVVKCVEDAVFCGRRFVETTDGLRDMADVQRTMRKFNTTMSLGNAKILLLAKALSYNYTDADSPLIGALTYAIICILREDPDCQSQKKLRAALSKVSSERWMLKDAGVSVRPDALWRVKPPDVPPEMRATSALYDDISCDLQLSLENQYLSWIDIGHIPATFDKLHCDWEPEPTNVVVCGDITLFHA
uniref:RNA-directed RNA polymerase n=1 Tax=Erebo virus TaxID=2800916 RepID=A0A894KDV3_9VIRU|nr:MAG: RNA-dependent RNA polymerase [Erebo virus]